MIAQWGLFCLIIAASLSLTGIIFRQRLNVIVLSRQVSVWIAVSYLLLSLCFLRNDFSLIYVLKNSSIALPWYYKLCAVWGGHEGSVLLWLTILSFWMFILSFHRDFEAGFLEDVLHVLMVLVLGLLLFIILCSNPFSLQFIDIHATGRDLNPLLQDPGFLLHPPLLYFGYVAYAIPYAFAMAALKQGQFSRQHIQLLKPWVYLAWICLSLGITLGSWWAYRELGWGGFWFWDPVENASLMPWLLGTALLHAVIICERQATFLAWTILLAVTAFALSLIGTFLVRSGVLTSVHAFAVDPKRGLYILGFLVFNLLWAYGLYLGKAHRLFQSHKMYWCSKETALLINSILLFMFMLIVLLGTLYPLIIDGLGLGKLSVGAPYFNTVLYPLLSIFLLIMGFAIHLKFLEDDARARLKKSLWPLIGAFILAGIWPRPFIFKAYLILGLAYWVILSLLQSLQRHKNIRYWAMFLAHMGFAITVIGVVVTSFYGSEYDLNMQKSEVQALSQYRLQYLDEHEVQGPNYRAMVLKFAITAGHETTYVYPEKRIYQLGQMPMTDAAIWTRGLSDLYISLGEPMDTAWTLRFYVRPLVRCIWLGGLLMALGGFLCFFYHRRYWSRL